MTEPVCIKRYNTRLEAEVVKSLLEAHGVQALIRADDEGGMIAPFTFSYKGVQLVVSEQDAQKALDVLATEKQ
jgi:Putative prokaryotic signal transducing protein